MSAGEAAETGRVGEVSAPPVHMEVPLVGEQGRSRQQQRGYIPVQVPAPRHAAAAVGLRDTTAKNGGLRRVLAALTVSLVLLTAAVAVLAYMVWRLDHRTSSGNSGAPAQAAALAPCESPASWTRAQGNVLVVHYEPDWLGDNYTAQMAAHVAAGAASVVGEDHVRVLQPAQVNVTADILLWADAVVVGTPVFNANVHPVVQQWINGWNFRADLSNKVGAAFVTAGGISAGEELTTVALLHTFMIFRMIIVGGSKWTFPFGASAVVEEQPFGAPPDGEPTFFNSDCYPTGQTLNALFVTKAQGLGQRVATVVKQLFLHP